MSRIYGFATWAPDSKTQPFLEEVLAVINANRSIWPLSQRSWLYRLMAEKGWKKVDEYGWKKGKVDPKDRHLCTEGKNLNNILNRGRRAGLIPWEAITSSRGDAVPPSESSGPVAVANWIDLTIADEMLMRQDGQGRRVALWIETEGMIPLLTDLAHEYGATLLSGQGFDVVDRKFNFAKTIAGLGDVLILHCGDLDRSGHTIGTSLDADISSFVEGLGGRMELKRIALTEEQAWEHCRHALIWDADKAVTGKASSNHGAGFVSEFECQLEALDIGVLRQIIRTEFEAELDMDKVREVIGREDEMKAEARRILVKRWS